MTIFHGLFFFCFRSFNTIVGKIPICSDQIRTTDLWCWKQPLHQLGHNLFAFLSKVYSLFLFNRERKEIEKEKDK